MSQFNQGSHTDAAESAWHGLYRVAGTSAVGTAVFIIVQMVVFIVWPPPGTAIDYFTLFQQNALLGYLALDLLYVIDNILLIPILLALYISLQRVNKSFMLIAAALGFIGIAALFASNPSANMHFLSGQYAAAATDAQRSLLLAAGEAMLALYAGTAYHVSLIIGSIALVIISVVMLQCKIFSKATAYMGILANVLALGLYLPAVGVYILLFSVVFLLIWYILLARRFLQLGRDPAKTECQ